jgi:hypothetical protein
MNEWFYAFGSNAFYQFTHHSLICAPEFLFNALWLAAHLNAAGKVGLNGEKRNSEAACSL